MGSEERPKAIIEDPSKCKCPDCGGGLTVGYGFACGGGIERYVLCLGCGKVLDKKVVEPGECFHGVSE